MSFCVFLRIFKTQKNPTNETSQSLLSSIGLNLNILAKKSPYSITFRFFARCMAICLLKQVMIVNEEEKTTQQNTLFPKLIDDSHQTSVTLRPKWVYKIRMSSADGHGSSSRGNFDNTSTNLLSTSLPSTSPLVMSPMSQHLQQQQQNQPTSELHNSYGQLLKQAAYQFHLVFQTKAYSNTPGLVDLANRVNQSLQSSSANSMHFCLPQCLNMSKHLCAHLFNDKFYLFP